MFAIIDKRWEDQLHQPLHVVGHFQNPGIFYDDPGFEFDEEVNKLLFNCMHKSFPEHQMQDKIIIKLSKYKNAEGLFGNRVAFIEEDKLSKFSTRLVESVLFLNYLFDG